MTERARGLSDRATRGAAAAHPTASPTSPTAPTASPSVSISLVRDVLLFATACGAPTQQARALLGAHAARLDDPDSRIPATVYDAVFVECSRALGDADFGVRLGSAARVSQLGVLGFLLSSSATLGAAFDAYSRYQKALGDTLQVRLQVRGETATLSILAMHHSASSAQRIEGMIAAIHVLTHELCGRPVPWRSLSLEHAPVTRARGAAPTALQRLLGLEPTRGPARLGFDRSALDWPVQHAAVDHALTGALRAHLDSRLEAADQASPARDVAAAVQRRLASRRKASLVSIAAELQLSPRLLQLRLRDDGTTFRAVADSVLEQAAVAFLKAGSSAAEVAHLLGYTEEAAFFRAFKRWTGRTPAQLRAAG